MKIFLGMFQTILRKKNSDFKKNKNVNEKMLSSFAEMSLRTLESSIQKHPGPGGRAPSGGCKGANTPAKKKLLTFFFSKFSKIFS